MGHFTVIDQNMLETASRRDATEFHICPPADVIYEQDECLGRLEAHMRERFPRLTFRAGYEIPFRQQGEFVLLPMTACCGGDGLEAGERQVLPTPDAELITALYQALAEFDPRASTRRPN